MKKCCRRNVCGIPKKTQSAKLNSTQIFSAIRYAVSVYKYIITNSGLVLAAAVYSFLAVTTCVMAPRYTLILFPALSFIFVTLLARSVTGERFRCVCTHFPRFVCCAFLLNEGPCIFPPTWLHNFRTLDNWIIRGNVISKDPNGDALDFCDRNFKYGDHNFRTLEIQTATLWTFGLL